MISMMGNWGTRKGECFAQSRKDAKGNGKRIRGTMGRWEMSDRLDAFVDCPLCRWC